MKLCWQVVPRVFSQKDVILLTLKGNRNFWLELAGASWPSLFCHPFALDKRSNFLDLVPKSLSFFFFKSMGFSLFSLNFSLTFLVLFMRKCRREKRGSEILFHVPLSCWSLSNRTNGISGTLKALVLPNRRTCHSAHTETLSARVPHMSSGHRECEQGQMMVMSWEQLQVGKKGRFFCFASSAGFKRVWPHFLQQLNGKWIVKMYY